MIKDDLDLVDIALLVSTKTFRHVLNELRGNGNRWWLASDPADAGENGYILVGFGEPLCTDRLNAAFFRIPVLDGGSAGLADGVYLVIAPALIEQLENGCCQQRGCHGRSCVGEFEEFYFPIKDALARLQAAGDTHSIGSPSSKVVQLHNSTISREE